MDSGARPHGHDDIWAMGNTVPDYRYRCRLCAARPAEELSSPCSNIFAAQGLIQPRVSKSSHFCVL